MRPRSLPPVVVVLAATLALTLALALATTACGQSDDGATAPATTTTAKTTPTTTTAPVAEGPVPSAGCGSSTVGAVDKEKRTLGDRWYLLTTPPEHDGDTPLPLVLDYHGLSEGAEIHSAFSQFGPYAAEHGFILVGPQGTGEPVGWRVSLDRTANADLAFTDQMLDQLEADLCVDTSRIYATGLSNGAWMSSALACSMADRIAAVAPVAGLMDADSCEPSRPIPVLAFHGTEDPILLFNGGVGDRLNEVLDASSPGAAGAGATGAPALPEADWDGPGYPANAAAWAERNGCTGDPIDTELTSTVTQRTWDCPAEAPVEFDIVVGGGHSWPGSEFGKAAEAIVGPTDMSIDATDAIWTFFQRFTLPAT